MKAFRLFIWMTALTGLIYPLSITLIAQWVFPKRANGSLLTLHQKTVGSALIAQQFEGNHYFWPRPSFVNYNPLPSGGSPWGPTNSEFKHFVETRREKLIEAFSLKVQDQIPSELIFHSASGLDPYITIECAHFQSSRIARERKIDQKVVDELIDTQLEKWQIGLLGPRCVNVLKLNIALDSL